jgi:hypothetical protein
VDTDRALAMASSADGDAQYISKRKIAQYVMLPASGKATLRFDRWMVPDTWLPGTPVER